MQAVDRFCRSIDGAGIRNRFYRLNLFCGNSDSTLAAVRTPLYRGQSPTGTQYGGTTDTNNNFVAGDYAETGASGGLIGNTTTKYLNTGLAPNDLPAVATGHLSFWTRGGSVAAVRRPIGCEATATANRFFIDRRPVANGGDLSHWGSSAAGSDPPSDDASSGLFSSSRTSSTDLRLFKNGSQVGPTQTSASTMTVHGNPWFVFANNGNGSPSSYYERRLAAYSIGDSMTAEQMLSYYNALNTFMAALRRDRPSSDIAFAAVTNEEAKLWIDNVYNNGGTVSTSTAAAVNTFCNDIDAAGIRDRFFRLNLFAGGNLAAALVPLFRGPTRTGTQFGNTTDTNFNFVAGDYAETGSTAGLKSDGSTKYLNTGFKAPAASLSATSFHLSCYVQGVESGGSSRIFIGNATNQAGVNLTTAIGWVSAGAVSSGVIADTTFPNGGSTDRQGLLLAATNGSQESTYYNNATSVVSQTSTQGGFETGTGDEFTIAARNFVGAIQLYSLNKRFRAYSLGAGMSASQVAAFNTAMQAFQAALTRNV
jgi:hypothetical protein